MAGGPAKEADELLGSGAGRVRVALRCLRCVAVVCLTCRDCLQWLDESRSMGQKRPVEIAQSVAPHAAKAAARSGHSDHQERAARLLLHRLQVAGLPTEVKRRLRWSIEAQD